MIKITLILIFILSGVYSFTQDLKDETFDEVPTSIFEVAFPITNDSIILYYNSRYQLVKPECAKIYRISKIDPVLATFSGYFIDFNSDSTKAIEGSYYNGQKNGIFKLYYPNGQIQEFGVYKDDSKVGKWEYYYANGNKRQILNFVNNEVLVLDFWDENGKQKVCSGTGKWESYETGAPFVKISGKILNGRKDGKWYKKMISNGFTLNVENYEQGTFLSGKNFSILGNPDKYADTIYCMIEQNPAFIMAEFFQFNMCYFEENNKREYARYPGGYETFIAELEYLIDIPENIIIGTVKIHVLIDKDGRMSNFNPISNTGLESAIIEALPRMNRWIPAKFNGEPCSQGKIIVVNFVY